MKKVIVSEVDVAEFLCYAISWGFDPTAINKEYEMNGRPRHFIFRLKKTLNEIDIKNIKRKAPSFNLYKI
jgi:hypothetical protein